MGDTDDYLLALELQRQYDKDASNEDIEEVPAVAINKNAQQRKRLRTVMDDDLNQTCNLVHPQWETLDPTPDAHSLFQAFDTKFFQSRLRCVILEWSKRMYSCAGICYSRRNNLGMSITIRLSEPLLKLRSRKDLVETLLHEMIHAYCFVLGIREGNGGHGPNFKKIMHGINSVAGTNITVYHTFHDEVDLYKTHIWRCNGICQNRKPFYGYVKRTSNRAPGPNDFWWRQHQESCGGSFLKVKEPEKKPKKQRKNATGKENQTLNKHPTTKQSQTSNATPTKDLRSFYPVIKNNTTLKGPTKSNGGGTLLLNPRTQPTTSVRRPQPIETPTRTIPTTQGFNLKNVVGFNDIGEGSSAKKAPTTVTRPQLIETPVCTIPTIPGGNLRNVVGFKDIGEGSSAKKAPTTHSISGQGYSLNDNMRNSTLMPNSGVIDRDKLRSFWANKFTQKEDAAHPISLDNDESLPRNDSKRRRLSQKPDSYLVDEFRTEWTLADDDVHLKDIESEIIDISSSDEEEATGSKNRWTQLVSGSDERERQIKREILEESVTDLNEDDIELIDDDYNETEDLNASAELADTSLIDDLFGEDTLLHDFNQLSDNTTASTSKGKSDVVSCPICQENLARDFLSQHLDGCVGITKKIEYKTPKCQTPKMSVDPNNALELLRKAGYSESDLNGVLTENEADVQQSPSRMSAPVDPSMVPCPVCSTDVGTSEINEHLDVCLGLQF